MKILIVLTYYRPHISGLTIYVERLASALASLGNEVTVMTSQYDKALPREEVSDGVRIVRVPVLFRISKGVIMPTFGFVATKLVRSHDVLLLHLPQFDAPGLALRGRFFNKPTVLTYHCDLQLPPGVFNRITDRIVHINNWAAARLTNAIVAYTEDYAQHSQLVRYLLDKVTIIPPPVSLSEPTLDDLDDFKDRWNLGEGPHIGVSARLATEKGAEVLLDALPTIIDRYPEARVLFAGPYEQVIGEEEYARRILPRIESIRDHWTFLGPLRQREMAAFYSNLDVLVLPSLNSTESFGLVQIEAMLCGVPVVASNLPGVRQPVSMTGMGEIAPIGDPTGLAESVIKVIENKEKYGRDPSAISDVFSPLNIARHYVSLFRMLQSGVQAIELDDAYSRLSQMK